jgi:hypothetical protein
VGHGEYLSELTFGAEAEKRYGAPYLLMHRGDLHSAFFSAVPPELIAYEKKLVGLERNGAGVTLRFADGSVRPRTPSSAPTGSTRWCARSCSARRSPSSPAGSRTARCSRPR